MTGPNCYHFPLPRNYPEQPGRADVGKRDAILRNWNNEIPSPGVRARGRGRANPISRFRAETSRHLDREQKNAVVGESRIHETDTGSVEVQVSLLTRRIAELSEHFRVHHHDHAGRRGLLRLVGERRRLLQYLSREEVGRYRTLVARLGLRK